MNIIIFSHSEYDITAEEYIGIILYIENNFDSFHLNHASMIFTYGDDLSICLWDKGLIYKGPSLAIVTNQNYFNFNE